MNSGEPVKGSTTFPADGAISLRLIRKSEVPWGEAWVNEELPAAPVIYSQEVTHEATQLFVYSSTGSHDTGFVIICDCGEQFTGRRDVSAEVVNKFREHVLCEIAARG